MTTRQRRVDSGAFSWLAALLVLTACANENRRAAIDLPDLAGWKGEPQVSAKIQRLSEQALAAPDSAAAIGRLAMTFHAHDLNREAVSCYERAMELDADTPRWPHLAARAAAATDLETALPYFERAEELGSRQPALYVALGDTLAQLERFEEAALPYHKALELDPKTTHALYGLAQVALANGEPEKAVDHLERAVELVPWQGEAHRLLAQTYQRLGRSEEAELALLRAGAYPETSRSPDPLLAAVDAEAVSSQAHSQRGRLLAARGRFALAEAEFRKVLSLRPESVRDLSNLGAALTAQGKLDQAVEQYRRALEIDPDDTYALNNLAMALARRGQLDQAAERLAAALEIDVTYADAHHNLGLVRAQQSRQLEAIEHYRQALTHHPSSAKAENDLGTALGARGEIEAAIEHWRRALTIDPRQVSALYNLSIALMQQGRHEEVIEQLRQGVAIAPNSSRMVSLLAWELATAPEAGLRDPARAEQLARRAYEALPDQPQLADVLAAALAAQGRFDEAIQIAEQALATAQRGGQVGLAAQLQRRLLLYRAHQPFVQGMTSRNLSR